MATLLKSNDNIAKYPAKLPRFTRFYPVGAEITGGYYGHLKLSLGSNGKRGNFDDREQLDC